jgi:transposase
MKYDAEFKRQTVQKILEGQSVRSVSRELGVTESQIHNWRRAALDNGDGQQSGAELTETQALRKRIRELEMENEILKKAALIFGRGS